MTRAIVFGLAAGAAIQAWRAFPPSAVLTPWTMVVVLLLVAWSAYLVGRRGRGASATATATATAVSESRSQAVNSVNIVLAGGAGYSTASESAGIRLPSDEAPWLVDGGRSVGALSYEQLQDLDLASVIEEQGREAV